MTSRVREIILFLQVAVLLVGWLRERERSGVSRERAMQEVKAEFTRRVDAAEQARLQPDDPGVDTNDRATR